MSFPSLLVRDEGPESELAPPEWNIFVEPSPEPQAYGFDAKHILESTHLQLPIAICYFFLV